ncbi:unnamed protein product [Peniophora sp. CBMAI 1063]|nr:unnamed protein product [Peniophora sp. CBMAI 1063]
MAQPSLGFGHHVHFHQTPSFLMAPKGSARSTGKCKSSDATPTEGHGKAKKRKGDKVTINATASSTSASNKVSIARWRSSTDIQTKALSVPKMRLVVNTEWCGEKYYVPTRERLEEQYEGYLDIDIDDCDLDEIDPEGDMQRFKTEYTISIKTNDGEHIGEVKLLAVDLTNSDDYADFWTCWETQKPDLTEFGWYREAAGTKCWDISPNGREWGLVARYFFAKPSPLGSSPLVDTPGYADWIKHERRILAFHRRVGYRRVGTSQYFALALNCTHPSRTIKPEADADYVSETPRGKSGRGVWVSV